MSSRRLLDTHLADTIAALAMNGRAGDYLLVGRAGVALCAELDRIASDSVVLGSCEGVGCTEISLERMEVLKGRRFDAVIFLSALGNDDLDRLEEVVDAVHYVLVEGLDRLEGFLKEHNHDYAVVRLADAYRGMATRLLGIGRVLGDGTS